MCGLYKSMFFFLVHYIPFLKLIFCVYMYTVKYPKSFTNILVESFQLEYDNFFKNPVRDVSINTSVTAASTSATELQSPESRNTQDSVFFKLFFFYQNICFKVSV